MKMVFVSYHVLHGDLQSNEYDDHSIRYHRAFRWRFSYLTKMRIQRHCKRKRYDNLKLSTYFFFYLKKWYECNLPFVTTLLVCISIRNFSSLTHVIFKILNRAEKYPLLNVVMIPTTTKITKFERIYWNISE